MTDHPQDDAAALEKRYAALDDSGKRLVHEIGALVLEAHARGRLQGTEEQDVQMRREGERLDKELAEFGRPVFSDGPYHESRDWLISAWEQGKRKGIEDAARIVHEHAEEWRRLRVTGLVGYNSAGDAEVVIRALLEKEQP